jgi:hypothetical protein
MRSSGRLSEMTKDYVGHCSVPRVNVFALMPCMVARLSFL